MLSANDYPRFALTANLGDWAVAQVGFYLCADIIMSIKIDRKKKV